VPEPEAARIARRHEAIAAVADQNRQGPAELEAMSGEQLVKARREKYLGHGANPVNRGISAV